MWEDQRALGPHWRSKRRKLMCEERSDILPRPGMKETLGNEEKLL